MKFIAVLRKIKFIFQIFAVLFSLLLSAFACICLVYYTPLYNNLKDFLVTTAMQTGKHQYIATLFLSQKQIDDIWSKYQPKKTQSQSVSNVNPLNTDSNDIEQYTINSSQFKGYVLEIKNPLRVKVAYTNYIGKVGETVSDMAERKDAVAAINGGGFMTGEDATGTGKYPSDFVISDGKVVWKDSNVSNDHDCDVIAINNSGTLIVGQYSFNDLKKMNITEAVTFQNYGYNSSSKLRVPPLILNGKGSFDSPDVDRQPRTVIAQKKDGTILMMVLDGRHGAKLGASFYEEQQILLTKFSTSDNPVVTAANLDGGGSTTMYYNGSLLNDPSGAMGERTVSTAFYVEK